MEEAQSRAEKLRLLKERAQSKRERDEGGGDADGAGEEGPKLKFRNYKVGIYASMNTGSSIRNVLQPCDAKETTCSCDFLWIFVFSLAVMQNFHIPARRKVQL
jgi:hypothetical protein